MRPHVRRSFVCFAASPPNWGTQPAWRPFGLAAAELLNKQVDPGVVVVPHKRMLGYCKRVDAGEKTTFSLQLCLPDAKAPRMEWDEYRQDEEFR